MMNFPPTPKMWHGMNAAMAVLAAIQTVASDNPKLNSTTGKIEKMINAQLNSIIIQK